MSRVMKRHAIIKPAVLASSALFVGATSGLTAGEPAPVMPAPVVPECGNAGWTVTAAALYLKSYAGSFGGIAGGGLDGKFDWGFRGSIGYERPDGLFFRAVGFWYEGKTDVKDFDGDRVGSVKPKAYSGDLLIGDTFCPTANTSLEVSAGLRYGKVEVKGRDDFFDDLKYEFDGWGPTVQLRGRRALTDRIALYADFQQSFLFGERELRGDGDRSKSDTLAAVSELRGGIEFGWGWNRIQNAYLRLGAEGQYWWVDSLDVGLVGGVAEVGFTF